MQVVFRVDASIEIGSGHFMRCLALADALYPLASIRFVCRHILPSLENLLHIRKFALNLLPKAFAVEGDLLHSHWLHASQEQDAQDTIDIISKKGKCDWIVIDHYSLDCRFQNLIRQHVGRILVIDDLADRIHNCDMLIDQNAYADQNKRYLGKVPSHCICLIGTRYCFIRNEFLSARKTMVPRYGPVRSILIYFGGIDNTNKTQEAVQTLLDLAASEIISGLLKVDVIIGMEHVACSVIQTICQLNNIKLHIQTRKMAELMSCADLAIGAGGISTFERLYLRLPALLTPISDNQREPLSYMESQGYFSIYKNSEELKKYLIIKLQEPNFSPPDCINNGIPKFLSIMLKHKTSLRQISPLDIRRTLKWFENNRLREDFKMDIIPSRKQHFSYWRKIKNNNSTRIFAIYYEYEHVGNCGLKNIDQINADCELWIYLGDQTKKGKGIATAAVESLKIFAKKELKSKKIYLHVSVNNLIATKLYLSTGFSKSNFGLSEEWLKLNEEMQRMECLL